jgi:hypothetical protein
LQSSDARAINGLVFVDADKKVVCWLLFFVSCLLIEGGCRVLLVGRQGFLSVFAGGKNMGWAGARDCLGFI